MSRPHIQKGMFLQGGAHPAHMLALDNSVLITRTPRQYLDDTPPHDPPSLDELKSRLQRVQAALAFIREEKPETHDEWLKRMGYW